MLTRFDESQHLVSVNHPSAVASITNQLGCHDVVPHTIARRASNHRSQRIKDADSTESAKIPMYSRAGHFKWRTAPLSQLRFESQMPFAVRIVHRWPFDHELSRP